MQEFELFCKISSDILLNDRRLIFYIIWSLCGDIAIEKHQIGIVFLYVKVQSYLNANIQMSSTISAELSSFLPIISINNYRLTAGFLATDNCA